MARLRHGAGGGTLIGAVVGYVAARSLDPRYDQAAMLLGVAAACCLAFRARGLVVPAQQARRAGVTRPARARLGR
jgi:hypothetical protein